jgi:hypothetical protein
MYVLNQCLLSALISDDSLETLCLYFEAGREPKEPRLLRVLFILCGQDCQQTAASNRVY